MCKERMYEKVKEVKSIGGRQYGRSVRRNLRGKEGRMKELKRTKGRKE